MMNKLCKFQLIQRSLQITPKTVKRFKSTEYDRPKPERFDPENTPQPEQTQFRSDTKGMGRKLEKLQKQGKVDVRSWFPHELLTVRADKDMLNPEREIASPPPLPRLHPPRYAYERVRQPQPPKEYKRRVFQTRKLKDGTHALESHAGGARKTATAKVKIISPPSNNIPSFIINDKQLIDYFRADHQRKIVLEPLLFTETLNKFDIIVSVSGGGFTGQSEAIRLGLSRALRKFDPDYRYPLKTANFFYRDPRQVERKKYGHKKARKSFQWVKR